MWVVNWGGGQLLFRNVRCPVGLVERKLLYKYSPLPHLALPRGEADLHGLFQGQSGPLLSTTSESVVCVHGARSLLRLRYRETDSPQSIFLTVPLPLQASKRLMYEIAGEWAHLDT